MAKSLEPKSRRKEFTYDVTEKTAESTAMTRRQALSTGAKIAIGAAAVVVAGGIGYYAMQAPPPAVTTTTTAPATTIASTTATTVAPATSAAQPFAGQTLRWLGPSFMIDDDIVKAYETQSGVNVVTTVTDLDTVRSRMLTGGANDFDEAAADSAIWQAWKGKNVTKNFAPSSIARWNTSYLDPIYVTPETVIGTDIPPPLGPSGPYIAKSVIWPHMWANTPGVAHPEDDYGLKDQMMYMAPLCWGYDSCLINPKFMPDVAKNMILPGTVGASWEVMYDRKYKGRSGILDSVATVTNHVAAYLIVNKMMAVPEVGANDLNPSELDTVINFLIEQKKAGQFRVTWSDFMQLVNLYLTEEVWVTDAWRPVIYPVRQGGTPCYYTEPVEGYRSWHDGNAPTTGASNDALVFDHMNWQFGPWYAINILKNAYVTATHNGAEIKTAFGDERYGWVYEGKATYNPFPDNATKPLFSPMTYDWHMQSGTPDTTNGAYLDGGTIERRTSHVAVWGRVPHNLDAYFAAWSKFRAA